MRSSLAWRVTIPAVAAVTVAALPPFLTGAVAVQMGPDIGLGLTGLGWTVGLMFAVSALTSPTLGRVVEQVGWPLSLRVATTGSALTLIGVAAVAGSPATLAAIFVLGGLAISLAQPAANLALARSVAPHRRGLAFGIKHGAVPSATLLGGIAVPAVALTVGWRWAFVAGSVLAAVTVLAIPSTSPRPSRSAEARPPETGDAIGRPRTPGVLLVLLAGAAGAGIAGTNSLATFLVTYAVSIDVSDAMAGALLAVGSAAGILTRVTAGWLIDRRPAAGFSAVATFMALGSLGLALVAVGTVSLLVIGSLLAMGAGWGWSGLFTHGVVTRNLEAPAAATGITQTGVFVGAALGPPLFGIVADGISFTAAWSGATAALLAASVVVLYVGRRTTPTSFGAQAGRPPQPS